MKTKQNRYMNRKRKLKGYSPKPCLPHPCACSNKKFKIFKLKEFFKFMLYTGFTYLFTRKLTKTPGSMASLHCFPGGHLRQKLLKLSLWWSNPPTRGWLIQTMCNMGNLYFIFLSERKRNPPGIYIRVWKLVGLGLPEIVLLGLSIVLSMSWMLVRVHSKNPDY